MQAVPMFPEGFMIQKGDRSCIYLIKEAGRPTRAILHFYEVTAEDLRPNHSPINLQNVSRCEGVVSILDSSGNSEIGDWREVEIELCELTLASVIENRANHWQVDELLNIVKGMIETLSFVHFHRIVHKAITVNNWMVTESGKVKLANFETAELIQFLDSVEPNRLADGSFTTRIFGDDVFSLAKVVFQMATLNPAAVLPGVRDNNDDEGIRRMCSHYDPEEIPRIISNMTKLARVMTENDVSKHLKKISWEVDRALKGNNYETFSEFPSESTQSSGGSCVTPAEKDFDLPF